MKFQRSDFAFFEFDNLFKMSYSLQILHLLYSFKYSFLTESENKSGVSLGEGGDSHLIPYQGHQKKVFLPESLKQSYNNGSFSILHRALCCPLTFL